MLNSISLSDKGVLNVKAAERTLTISESLSLGWQLELPNKTDLLRIRQMAFTKVSVPETVEFSSENMKRYFVEQKYELMRKRDRFSESSTYWNRLANLNEMIGDIDQAVSLWDTAYEKEHDVIFRNKAISAYIQSGRIPEAAERLKQGSAEGYARGMSRLYDSFISLAQGDVESAAENTDRLLYQEDGDRLNTIILAGALAYMRNENKRAVFFFREALKQRDTSSFLYVNMALAYQKLGEQRKCMNALRKAVALGPLNGNAIIYFADTMHLNGKDAESINALQRYLKYNQKDIAVLDRLALAQFSTNDFKSTLETLKLRAGVKAEPEVWNNIGVTYARLNDTRRAKQYYAQAIEGLDYESEDVWLPYTNLLFTLRHEGNFSAVVEMTQSTMSDVSVDWLAVHPVAYKVIASHLVALSMLNREKEALVIAEQLFSSGRGCRELHYELLMFLTSYCSRLKGGISEANDLASIALTTAADSKDIDPKTRMYLINNAAFAFLESNRISDAEHALSRITSWIHKESCPTATLGLLNIRSGKVKRGEALYQEAMRLSTDEILTEKIKQKLSIELAKVCVKEGNYSRAKMLLKRIKAGKGNKYYLTQAKELLNSLSVRDK